MAEPTGQAPASVEPSGSPGATSSPSTGDSPSAGGEGTEQVKELRRKVQEQGEELKKLRAVNEQALSALRDPNIRHYLSEGTFPDSNGNATPEFDIAEKAKEVFERGDAETFARFIQEVQQRAKDEAVQEVSQQVGKHLGRENMRALRFSAREFFREKKLPDSYADLNGEFFQFVEGDAAKNDWVRTLWDSGDYEAALQVSWDRFTRNFGDPSKVRQERERQQERIDASLEDAEGLPPDLVKAVQPGGERSFLELFKELEKGS